MALSPRGSRRVPPRVRVPGELSQPMLVSHLAGEVLRWEGAFRRVRPAPRTPVSGPTSESRTHRMWLCGPGGQPAVPVGCAGRCCPRVQRSKMEPPRCPRRPGTRWGRRGPLAALAGPSTVLEPASRPGRRRCPGPLGRRRAPGGCARRGRRWPRAAEQRAGAGCPSRKPTSPPAPSQGAPRARGPAGPARTPAGRAAWRGRAPAARTPGSRSPACAESFPSPRRRPDPGWGPAPGSGTSSPRRLDLQGRRTGIEVGALGPRRCCARAARPTPQPSGSWGATRNPRDRTAGSRGRLGVARGAAQAQPERRAHLLRSPGFGGSRVDSVGAEEERPGRSAGRRVRARGPRCAGRRRGPGRGARRQRGRGTHRLVARTGGRCGLGGRRQAGWRLGDGVPSRSAGNPGAAAAPPRCPAPTRPGRAAPSLPAPPPPGGVSAGAGAAVPRDPGRPGARREATARPARGTQRPVSAKAGDGNRPGARWGRGGVPARGLG